MTVDLSPLTGVHRLLFEIPLRPLLGQRFQPTGFPNLGAATFDTADSQCLLLESAQSMANWLEAASWDASRNDLKAELDGLSHVRVLKDRKFLTDSVLDAHRLNSPYVLRSKATDGSDKVFEKVLLEAFDRPVYGLIDRKQLAKTLLKYDVGSLLHGVFFSHSSFAGGRLRLARSISAFIEAEGVRVAASGGVKNDDVHPGKVDGDKENRFGNIPFSRDEFTAERIILYANIDLAQIRGFGLGADVEELLVLLALYKLSALMTGGLRLRTACDLEPLDEAIAASAPASFLLPATADLLVALKASIAACKDQMTVSEVSFDQVLKPAKGKKGPAGEEGEGE